MLSECKILLHLLVRTTSRAKGSRDNEADMYATQAAASLGSVSYGRRDMGKLISFYIEGEKTK